MKTSVLFGLLAVALAANAWLLRPRSAPSSASLAPAAAPAAPGGTPSLAWSGLPRENLAALAAGLRAAALPPHLQRAILAAEIDEQFRVREEALRGPRKKLKYWQAAEPPTLATRQALAELRREKSRLRLELLGADPADAADEANFLPTEKRTAARLITEDYAAALKELRDLAGGRGILLPAERAQLTALENEQRRELAALLTPAELAELEIRNSPTTQQLRQWEFAMNPTEEEFRNILSARQAIELEARGTDKPVTQFFDLDNREDLRTKLDAAVKAALGDTRFAEYKRAKDNEFMQLAMLSTRVGAPLDGAVQAWNVRFESTAESIRIAENKALSDEQKGEALKALVGKTREQIGAVVGSAVANAYLQNPSTSWFAYLDRGWAVTIRDRGMEMRPVSPAAKASQVRPPAVPPRP